MSKPSVLHAVDELDNNGFYNNSTLLGDLRTTPTLLDTVLDNGIYTFIGGTDSPTDNNGSYKWCLRVYSSDDCTSTEHIAERYILNDDKRKVFVRSRSSNTWTSWVEDAGAATPVKYVSISIPASGWSNNQQAVTVTGVLADESKQLIQLIPALSSQTNYYNAGVLGIAQSENSITFSCETVPTVDLNVYVTITEVSA